MGLQSASHAVHVCVMAVEAESRLLGTGAFVEPHVAPLLVRPIRFQFLQLCCLGARMVDRPLLPTASNRDASNVLDYLEIPVTRPWPWPWPWQRRQRLALSWAATETLLPAASLLVKRGRRGGGYQERSHVLYVYIYIYVMCTM